MSSFRHHRPDCCKQSIVAVIFLILSGSAVALGAEPDTVYTDAACIACHRTGSTDSKMQIFMPAYEASVHAGEITCRDCHTGVQDDTHLKVVGSGAVDCSGCHEQENRHGAAGPDGGSPQCHDCHSRHRILPKNNPASTVHADRLPVTCGGCHPAATRDPGFFSWFPAVRIASHHKGDWSTAYEPDNCLGCHQGAGAHGEPAPINGQTCYRCHGDATAAGAMWGPMHAKADWSTQPAVFAAASIYQVCIVMGLALVVVRLLKKGSGGGRSDSAE